MKYEINPVTKFSLNSLLLKIEDTLPYDNDQFLHRKQLCCRQEKRNNEGYVPRELSLSTTPLSQ